MKLLVLALTFHASCLYGQDDLAGSWSGHWAREGDTLAVEVTFEKHDGKWRGSFDSERLRVVGIPFTEVTFEPPRVAIRLVGDRTTMAFEGRLDGDSLTGTFTEESSAGSFALARAAVPPPALREEEVAFSNGDVRLAGSLILPQGEGPHPAVVFLHGSGAEGRWASRYLGTRLARAGFAALVYDKRGVAGSSGDWRSAGFEDLAADARAAIAMLAERPDIDPSRIGIHGHSQGGTITPLVASSEPALAFVVASAAAGVPTDETEVYSLLNSVGAADLPPEDRALAEAFVREVVAVAYHGAARARLDSLDAKVRGRPWAFELPPPDHSYWAFSRRIADYDALAHWRRVESPVLLLFGELDARVPPVASAEAITRALLEDGIGQVTVHVFPGADHTFRVPGRAWPRTVAGYPDALLDWLSITAGGPDSR